MVERWLPREGETKKVEAILHELAQAIRRESQGSQEKSNNHTLFYSCDS
jgi:hypothetical protein